MKLIKISIIFTILLSTFACDVNDPSNFEKEYIVESYLFAREPLPEVRLSQTVPFGTAYLFEEQAVSGAQISISQIDDGGNVVNRFGYREISNGIYAANTNDIVLPLFTYSLEVTVPDENNSEMRASVFVPDSFSVVSTNSDTVVFQATEQFEIDVTPSFFPNRQSVFVFSIEAFDITFNNLTPFYKDVFDEDKDDLEDFRVNESPLINEGNYDQNPDGTLSIKLPWIAIAFFGETEITVFAVDDNMFNFISSQNLQSMPSTLSPGEIPAVIDPIEGGTGIFGAYARIKTSVFIKNPLE